MQYEVVKQLRLREGEKKEKEMQNKISINVSKGEEECMRSEK